MNRTREMFDDRIADWLETDPLVAPTQVLETVVAALPSVPQRRAGGPLAGLLAVRGLRFVPIGAMLVVAALVLLVVAVGIIGPQPSPSPTPPADEVSLVAFDSPLYGYSMSYPEGWRVTPAGERIVGINPPYVDTGVADQFNGLGELYANATIVAAMAEVAGGTTLDNWTSQTALAVCAPPSQPQETIEVAGQPATVSTFARCNGYFHIWVTFVRGSQAFHVVWLNFSGTELADRQLLDRILATFTLPQPAATSGPTPAPSVPGGPIPDELIGAWYHPAPAFMTFFRAGDPYCVDRLRTELDCALWHPVGLGRENAIVTLQGDALSMAFKTGFCSGGTTVYTMALSGDSLTLTERPGGCQGGNLRLVRAGTGGTPTSPPEQ